MLIAAVFSLIIIELQKVELSGLNGEEVDLHRATNQRYWGELSSTAGEVHLHHQVPPLLDRLPLQRHIASLRVPRRRHGARRAGHKSFSGGGTMPQRFHCPVELRLHGMQASR